MYSSVVVLILHFGFVWSTPDIKGYNTQCFAYQSDLNIIYLRSISGRTYDTVIGCDPNNKLYSDYPILAMEALRYEIRRVNSDKNLLPNTTLGFVIADICNSDLAALTAMLYSMPNEADQDKFPDDQIITCDKGMRKFSNVIAGVGPSFSTAGVMVGAASSLYEVPLVLTWATSDELSDKTRFAYTMRVVPPDSFAAEAMIDLMVELGWNYAVLLYMEGSYGENGAKQVEKQAKLKGVCIAFSTMIPSGADLEEIDEVVQHLFRTSNVRVIISYLFSSLVQHFKALLEGYGRGTDYMWLGSDSFPLGEEGTFYDGAIGVDFETNYDEGFHEYFEQINPLNNPDNPWMPYFWERRHGCTWNESYGDESCQKILEKPHGYIVAPTAGEGKPMDGVQVIAKALHSLILDKCPTAFGNRDLVRECVKGLDLHEYMLMSSFTGFSGKIQFDEKGDFLGKYIFRQYQHSIRDIVAVAIWDKLDGTMQLLPEQFDWYSHQSNDSTKGLIPEAVCSHPCKSREFYIQKELQCCWECRECRNNEIVVDNRTNCEVCPSLTWPDEETASECLVIEPDTLKWTSPLAISIISITSIGMICCLITSIIFMKNKDTKLIKASSRQLMAVILFGIISAYVTAIILLLHPSVVICYIGRFGFNLSVSFIFAPLMIKTSRVYRIFSAGKKGTIRPALTGTRAQIVMTTTSIISQLMLCIASSILAPPNPVYRMQVPTEKYVEVLCSLPLSGLLPPLCLNLLFILTCAAFGFLTRKLPENFNESWYIFVSVATTTFLWLVFLPAYFTAFYAVHQIALLISCLIINATITLLCLYFPKIYCIYFLDENSIQFQTAGTVNTVGTTLGGNSQGNQSVNGSSVTKETNA